MRKCHLKPSQNDQEDQDFNNLDLSEREKNRPPIFEIKKIQEPIVMPSVTSYDT